MCNPSLLAMLHHESLSQQKMVHFGYERLYEKSRINTKTFLAHALHSALTMDAYKKGLSLSEIEKAAVWSNFQHLECFIISLYMLTTWFQNCNWGGINILGKYIFCNNCKFYWLYFYSEKHCTKMKFSVKDFSSKCDI